MAQRPHASLKACALMRVDESGPKTWGLVCNMVLYHRYRQSLNQPAGSITVIARPTASTSRQGIVSAMPFHLSCRK